MSDNRLMTYDAPCRSDCCQADVYCDIDICSDCKDHCVIICVDDDTGLDYIYNEGETK